MGLRGPAAKPREKQCIRFRPGVPPPPEWLDADGATEYKRAAAELEAADGALQQVDDGILAIYAQAKADIARISRSIRAEGEVIVGPQGVVANPLFRALTVAQAAYKNAMAQLGFSPAARAKIPRSGATGKPDNPFLAHVK